MPQQEMSPRVLAFLAEHIETVEHFQLLVRLVESADRWWDATTVARELGFAERDAQAALDHLARHNLLDIRITGEIRYQFHPGNRELRDTVIECTDLFHRRPLQVLETITGPRARSSIRDFADAFRIRKDDDDDR